MTPSRISRNVVVDRLEWVERMVAAIRNLPLHDQKLFFADARNIWTADSCLRRALEAIFDLGRHILARAFGIAANEYKQVATRLHEHGVLTSEDAALLKLLAGYRNRLVHFYHEVSQEELYQVCVNDLADIERIAAALRHWLQSSPQYLDNRL